MLSTVIHFNGNCDEAIKFYKKVLGAVVKDIAYFKDAPDTSWAEESLPSEFVMHSEVVIYGSTIVMTDGAESNPNGSNFSFMIIKNTEEEVTELYNKLLDGGKEIQSLGTTFWATMYGMVEDRFGVTWQVMTGE